LRALFTFVCMKSFWRILKFARPYRLSAFLNILFNLLATVFSLASIGLVIPVLRLIFNQSEGLAQPPFYEGRPIDFAKDYLNYEVGIRIAETGQSQALLYLCFWVIGAFFFKNMFRYLALFSIAALRNGVTRDLRIALHGKFLQLPIGYFTNEKRKGDMISRMTSDLKEIEWSLLHTLESLFRDPIMIIGSLIILLVMSPQLTVFVLILLPVMSIIITSIGKSLKRSSGKAQDTMGRILSQVEENLSGLKVIKAFNAAEAKNRIFKNSADRYFVVMNRVLRKTDLASPMSEFMGATVFAVIIWYGGGLVLSGSQFTAEEFIAYILFFYQIIAPSKSLSKISYQIQRGNASGERVMEILDAENLIRDTEHAREMVDFDREIHFNQVSFTYPGHETEVLHQLDLRVPKGKMIALVGQSGSGKTTLTNLVPRFYDVSKGSLEIDNVDIRDLKIDSLRAHLGIVTQESLLFNESVRYNIALGKPDASMEEIEKAARIANAHEFIEKLEQGYDTNIGDGGSKLSGGQKQRLSIARAVLKNPPILILDEATSALDTESEKLVQEALFKLMQNRTSLVIAHRLSTIQHADEIIVMDSGKIAERGSHYELLAKKGIYHKLVEMQSFD
jgi:subfamily B ATP-binding cassette protein MsbA